MSAFIDTTEFICADIIQDIHVVRKKEKCYYSIYSMVPDEDREVITVWNEDSDIHGYFVTREDKIYQAVTCSKVSKDTAYVPASSPIAKKDRMLGVFIPVKDLEKITLYTRKPLNKTVKNIVTDIVTGKIVYDKMDLVIADDILMHLRISDETPKYGRLSDKTAIDFISMKDLTEAADIEYYKSYDDRAALPSNRPTALFNHKWNLKETGIAGYDHIFEKLIQKVLMPRVLPVLKLKGTRGVLLHGPPGTGKTMVARAIANMFNPNMTSVKMISAPEVNSKWVGESSKRVRGLFSANKELNVAIIDEIDVIMNDRGSDNHLSYRQVTTQFLSILDGLNDKDVLIIGTTNRIGDIDPAMLRPGRMDCHIELGMPDFETRKAVLGMYLAPRASYNWEDHIDEYSHMTGGLSCADLSSIVGSTYQKNVNDYIKIDYAFGGIDIGVPDDINQLRINHSDMVAAIEGSISRKKTAPSDD